MGEEFTAKDFRTWGGTLTAAIALAEHGVPETDAEAKTDGGEVMRRSASGSETRRRCTRVIRQPAVVEQYLDGRTLEDFRPGICASSRPGYRLDPEENALLSLLRSWRIKRARKAA
jgi:DNA topoisomerase-1